MKVQACKYVFLVLGSVFGLPLDARNDTRILGYEIHYALLQL